MSDPTRTLSASLLGPEGPVAKRLAGYEPRPEQLAMAEAVQKAFDAKRHLLVEAGTGVGKSFAYLVPAILQAGQHKRVVISTHTISLQEQLLEKDVPFLRSVLPYEFNAVLVKGRSNYLCVRRLTRAIAKADTLFATLKEQHDVRRVADWARGTTDGTLSDLPMVPSPAVWHAVCSESGSCPAAKCPFQNDCFYYKARRGMYMANILVVNHALLMTDLLVKADGGEVLPDFDLAVIDEAHTLEGVATDHLGTAASDSQVRFLLTSLFNDRTGRGILAAYEAPDAVSAVQDAYKQSKHLFDELRFWRSRESRSNGRVGKPRIVENTLSSALMNLGKQSADPDQASGRQRRQDRTALLRLPQRGHRPQHRRPPRTATGEVSLLAGDGLRPAGPAEFSLRAAGSRRAAAGADVRRDRIGRSDQRHADHRQGTRISATSRIGWASPRPTRSPSARHSTTPNR